MEFVKAEGETALRHLAALADEVWHEFFVSILSKEQIDYMVDKFQSYDAFLRQIAEENYEYYFLRQDGKDLGYTAIAQQGDRLFLSKLYLMKENRGKGYASQAFSWLKELCRERGVTVMWLTVNKYNDHSIAVYEKKGFRTVRAQVTDIGSGYVMDDFVMELEIA